MVIAEKLTRPLRDALSFAVPGDVSCGCFIVGLGDPVSPTNIARFISTVYVDAVQRVFWGGARTNVFKKRIVAIAPFFAHADTLGPVVVVTGPRFAVTTSFNAFPSVVLRSVLAVSNSSVRFALRFFKQCVCHAAARFNTAITQASRISSVLVPAVALTKPHGLTRRVIFCPGDGSKKTKPLSVKVDQSGAPGFVLQAPAGFGKPPHKVLSVDFLGGATLAFTQPEGASFVEPTSADYNPSTKSFVYEIIQAGHRYLLTGTLFKWVRGCNPVPAIIRHMVMYAQPKNVKLAYCIRHD